MSYERSFLLSRAAAADEAASRIVTRGSSVHVQHPQAQSLITHRVVNRAQRGGSTVDEAQAHQKPYSAPSSSSGANNCFLEPQEWAKLARFQGSTYQQTQAHRRNREVLLSTAMRCHPTALEGSKLSMASNSVTQIDMGIIPALTALRIKTLYLSSNSLFSLENVDQFANLITLSAASNCIRYLQELRPLGILENLEKLSLEGNIVASMPFYREHVLGLCQRLISLDNKQVSGAERSQAKAEFKRVSAVLENSRCNEFRVAVVAHLLSVTKCRIELAERKSLRLENLAPLPSLCFVVRILLSGGVYRWAQIGCSDHFDRAVQDLALRAHLHLLRKISQAQRMQLSRRSEGLSEHWHAVMIECSSHQHNQIQRYSQLYERFQASSGGTQSPSAEAANYEVFDALVFIGNSSATEYEKAFSGGPTSGAQMPTAPPIDVTRRSYDAERHPVDMVMSPSRRAVRPQREVSASPMRQVKAKMNSVVVRSSVQSLQQGANTLQHEKRASTHSQYQGLLKTMGTGPPSSLSGLLPPQQKEPEATVHASDIKVKRKPPSPSRAPPQVKRVPTVVVRPAATVSTSSMKSKSKNVSATGSAGSLVGDDEKPFTFDFTSEHYRSWMARARESLDFDAGSLVFSLESLWQRPLPAMETRPLQGTESPIESVLGPEPRDAYQRHETAASISELKVQIQSTLNDISQYQREEYFTWAASEFLRKHASSTQRAVVDVADTALSKISVLNQTSIKWREENEQGARWAQMVESMVESLAVEKEKVNSIRETILLTSRRRETTLGAKLEEDKKMAEILRSMEEVDEATAVMIAEIEANPYMANLAKAKLALTSALDMADKSITLLRKIFGGWRARVGRQRCIKNFAAIHFRTSKLRACTFFFGQWARLTRVTKVSSRIQNNFVKRVARQYLSLWKQLCVRSKRLKRLSKKKLRVPTRAAFRRWRRACADGSLERRRRKELEAIAACFIKIRIFRGWKGQVASCKIDPGKERINSVKAQRHLLRKLFLSWTNVVRIEIAAGNVKVVAASTHCETGCLARSWREWCRFVRVNRFAKASASQRGMNRLVQLCTATGWRQKMNQAATRLNAGIMVTKYLVFWKQLTAKRARTANAAVLVASRWKNCLVRGNWRHWRCLRQEARHMILKEEAGIKFFFAMLLRRHFYCWRSVVSRTGRAEFSGAPQEPDSSENIVEEDSLTISSHLINDLHAKIAMSERSTAMADAHSKRCSIRRLFARFSSRTRIMRVLRRKAKFLQSKMDVSTQRQGFSSWLALWLRGNRTHLETSSVLTAEDIQSAETYAKSLRLTLTDLYNARALMQDRAEHLSDGCLDRDSRLGDVDLETRETLLSLEILKRDASETSALVAKLTAECKAILQQKDARDEMSRHRHSLPLKLSGGVVQLNEKEAERVAQKTLLQNTEEHYQRAVLSHSQAQLRQDALAAETRSLKFMSKLYRKQLADTEQQLDALAAKRQQTEKAIVFCGHTLEESVARGVVAEASGVESVTRIAEEENDLMRRLEAAEEEERVLSIALEASHKRLNQRAFASNAIDAIDFLGQSQATLRLAEEDVKATVSAGILLDGEKENFGNFSSRWRM